MAAGEVKNDDAMILVLKAGTTVTVGQVVHEETDGKWDPGASADGGPWAVALDAAADTESFRAVKVGQVTVTYGGTNDCPIGGKLIICTQNTAAATDGLVGQVTHGGTLDTSDTVCGFAMELMDTSGTVYTMMVGLGGS